MIVSCFGLIRCSQGENVSYFENIAPSLEDIVLRFEMEELFFGINGIFSKNGKIKEFIIIGWVTAKSMERKISIGTEDYFFFLPLIHLWEASLIMSTTHTRIIPVSKVFIVP